MKKLIAALIASTFAGSVLAAGAASAMEKPVEGAASTMERPAAAPKKAVKKRHHKEANKKAVKKHHHKKVSKKAVKKHVTATPATSDTK